MKRRVLIAAIAVALISFACSEQATPPPQVDDNVLLITGGTIITMTDAGVIENGAVVVRDGRIDFVGARAEADSKAPDARRLDITGLTMMPGLTDAHAHISGLGAALASVDLTGTASYDEVVDRIAEFAVDQPTGEWIVGRGWDQNDWPEKEFPTHDLLDSRVPHHPVAVRRIDGHAVLANSMAMELADVDAGTVDPPGGKIHRDSAGNPTGVFVDNAMGLIGRAVPGASREKVKEDVARAARFIASRGLTEVHDAGTNQDTIEILKELADEGQLPIRTYLLLNDDDELLERWFAEGPMIDYEGRVTVRAIKLYADGALGSRGAALLEPYEDDPGNEGLLVTQPDHILERVRRAREAGFQVGTHAIGDRGNRIILDAYEEAGVTSEERYRVEHLQIIALEDIPRLAGMGVIASMQPTHATSDMPWAEDRVGIDRIAGAYAWRKVLDSGTRLAFGSDFPVERVNPLEGLFSAVNRTDAEGHPEGGWLPDERLSVEEAIAGFTIGAAFAAFEETSRGSIEAGKLADFTIVDRNPMEIDPAEIDDLVVRYTIVDGEIVYESNED